MGRGPVYRAYDPAREEERRESRREAAHRKYARRWQRVKANPERHARKKALCLRHREWSRRVKVLLGYPDHASLPAGMRLVNALHRRALELLALGADAEMVYAVWAEWQTLRRLALVKAGLVDITPREDA